MGIDNKPEEKKIKIRKFPCEDCGKSFNSKDNYNLHSSIHKEKPHGNQICKVCCEYIIGIDDLLVHMDENHKDTLCKVCSRYFCSIDELLAHMDEKHKDTPNEDNANDQTKENKPVKAAKTFKCSYCVSKFSQKHNLKTHVKKKHENYIEKKHSCPHCGLKFLLIHTLDNHIDTEHKENVDENEESKRINEVESEVVTKHDKLVHEENYNIDTVPLDTSSEQELSMSIFTCHHCNETFSSERNVELHIDFHHDGEKPDDLCTKHMKQHEVSPLAYFS